MNLDKEATTSENRLIYACAGVANTGFLADRVARRFHKEGVGRMTCLAAVGAGQEKFISEARDASERVVIDGCPIACGKRIFDDLGLSYTHFKTTDFGVEKKKTEITDQVVERVHDEILANLQ